MKPPPEVLVIRHVEHVSIGSLAAILVESGLAWRYVDLFADAPARLPLEQAAGLVILGGTMSANDTREHPFLDTELPWIREAVARDVPTLGICLGAQVMARAFGKRVFANCRKEIGFRPLAMRRAAADDELFTRSKATETVFQWHGDTFDLPDDAVWLAASAECAHQAFRIGRRAWAVQFHIEMTGPLLEEWLCEPGFAADLAALDYVDPEQIRRDAPGQLPAMEAFCHRLLRRFAAICAAGSGANS